MIEMKKSPYINALNFLSR